MAYARNCSALKIKSVLYFLEIHQPFSSSSITKSSNNQSIAVSYLINTCGLSQERALLASKHVNFKTPKNADSVLAFFRNHEFSDAQISTLIRIRPKFLLYNPDNTLFPKFEFLLSIGFSRFDIPKLICVSPDILERSLENHLIPAHNFLKDLFRSNGEDIVFAIKQYPEVLAKNLNNTLAPNIAILRDAGVVESSIASCLVCMLRVLMRNPRRFKESVDRVKTIGFNPQKANFLEGVFVMASTATKTWKHKMEVYKRCGWSEEEVLAAFRRFPRYMFRSENKITAVIYLLVQKMGFDPSVLVKRPLILSFSLKKRIIPRCAVYQVLLSRDLVNKKLSIAQMLEVPEKLFLQRFVRCHKEEAAELLKLYQENLISGKIETFKVISVDRATTNV